MGDADTCETQVCADTDIEYVVATKATKALCIQRFLTYRAVADHVGVGGAYR